MELNKYNTILTTFREWEERKEPFNYEIHWESIEEPGNLKSWTGRNRETGVEKFQQAIEKLIAFPNCAKIHISVYSGKTGKKEMLSETISISRQVYSGSYPLVQPDKTALKTPKSNDQPTDEPRQQANNPQLDMIGLILGAPGLNGTDALHGLLNFRDERLETRYKIMDYEKEIAQLKFTLKSLEEKLNAETANNDELEGEIESLEETIEKLTIENERLKKYVPENSALGLSLVQLGASIGQRIVGNIVKSKPEQVANLLGTDPQTLMGIFSGETENDVSLQSTAPQVSTQVKMESVEEISPARKQELDIIESISEYLKTLDKETMSYVRAIVSTWMQNKANIGYTYQLMAQASKQESNETITEEEE